MRFALVTLLLLIGHTGFAQGNYSTQTTDGNYIYIDIWIDSPVPPPPPSCETYTTVDSTFAGQNSSATSYYPNIAQIVQQTAATGETDYSWSRDIYHYGQQRGGNCGIFLQSSFTEYLSLASFTSRTSNPGSIPACHETLACANPALTPVCPVNAQPGNVTTFDILSLPPGKVCASAYFSSGLAYKVHLGDARQCINAGVSIATTVVPGICTYKP